MSEIKFYGLDEKQLSAVKELAPYIPAFPTEDLELTFECGEKFSVSVEGSVAKVSYTREHQIYRALSLIPDMIASGKTVCDQKTGYGMLCYMADMSRNAVYNMPSAKRMLLSFLQLKNAWSPILVMPAGNEIAVRTPQS